MKSFPYLFLLVLLIGFLLMNYVIYYPIKASYSLNKKQAASLRLFLLFMTMFFLWGEVFRRFWSISILSSIGSVWLGILSIAFFVMLIDLIIILIFPSIAKFTTTISLALIFFSSAFSLYNSSTLPRVKEIPLYSEKITPELDGFRVVFVSEFHLKTSTNKKLLTDKINKINSLNADLIVIGGDIIDDNFTRVAYFAELFRSLKSRHGIYTVAGNHDYYQNIRSFTQFCEAANFITLMNRNSKVTEGITVVGVTDPTALSMNIDAPNVEKAYQGADASSYIIFVSHQPLYYEEALSKGADLLLSGHTHRGQIPPMNFLVKLRYKYAYGLRKIGQSYQYTTSGISTWGPSMRLFSDNEIVLFTLHSAQSDR